MNLDDEEVVKVVMEVGGAVFRLLDNTDTITKEMIIDELERYRKEVTNTLHKGALRDAAQVVRSMGKIGQDTKKPSRGGLGEVDTIMKILNL